MKPSKHAIKLVNTSISTCYSILDSTRWSIALTKMDVVDVDVCVLSHLKKSWLGLQINDFRLLVL